MFDIKKMSKKSIIYRSVIILVTLCVITFGIAVSAKETDTNAVTTASETTTAQESTKVTTTEKTTEAPTTSTTTKKAENKKVKAKNVKKSSKRFDTISNFDLPECYSLDENGVPVNYGKKLEGSATAYYGGYSTSIGKTPQPGYIAVDPEIIPYGTEMWIVSNDGSYVYGYAIAADTGGFIYYGDTLADLYFNTYDECINFGRRDITIYIL